MKDHSCQEKYPAGDVNAEPGRRGGSSFNSREQNLPARGSTENKGLVGKFPERSRNIMFSACWPVAHLSTVRSWACAYETDLRQRNPVFPPERRSIERGGTEALLCPKDRMFWVEPEEVPATRRNRVEPLSSVRSSAMKLTRRIWNLILIALAFVVPLAQTGSCGIRPIEGGRCVKRRQAESGDSRTLAF